MPELTIRFCTEGDELDEKIAAEQHFFWATHCEIVRAGGEVLKFDDNSGIHSQGWQWMTSGDHWIKQLVVNVPATDAQAARFYSFLHFQVGKGYDYRLLEGKHMRQPLPNRWGCADLIHAALVEAAIFQCRKPLGLHLMVTPRDLLMMLSTVVQIPEAETREAAA